MLVTNLYRVSPYSVSPSLKSCFVVLLEKLENWRLLLLSERRSVRMRVIVSGVSSPVFTCGALFPLHIASMCELTMAYP